MTVTAWRTPSRHRSATAMRNHQKPMSVYPLITQPTAVHVVNRADQGDLAVGPTWPARVPARMAAATNIQSASSPSTPMRIQT